MDLDFINNAECEQISVEELKKLRKISKPLLLLDVREDWEVEICKIEGSTHIPMAELFEKCDQLPKDKAIIVICHHGIRSLQVTQWLRRNGFKNAFNMAGGVDEWAVKIDKKMQKY